jgi:tRNA threonylcarbamoyladenosine biosynthesis protein TsaB
MLVVGIETSTPQASVTIGSEQGMVASCSLSRGVTTGEFLMPALKFLLETSGLDFDNFSAVAVGRGPGLFTGMRVGMATAKTLAQVLGTPMVGVPSLDVLAFDARYSDKLICPVLDARRKEVFFSFYRPVPGGITRVADYSLGSPRTLAAEIEGFGQHTLVLGTGALLHSDELSAIPTVEVGSMSNAFPRATSLVELALLRLYREDYDRLVDLEPMYMRRSDAEINWEKRRG